MLELSKETEALARSVADARNLPVDAVVREALEASHRVLPLPTLRNLTPEQIAERIAAIDRIVGELASLPVLDPRPVQQIVDDINVL